MREVLAHGPVTIVVEVPSYLGIYKEGVIFNECPIPEQEISEYLTEGTSSVRFQMRVKTRASKYLLFDEPYLLLLNVKV